MLLLVFNPRVGTSFLGLGSIKFLSPKRFFSSGISETEVVMEMDVAEYYEDKSVGERQNPIMHYWGSISIWGLSLDLSFWMN